MSANTPPFRADHVGSLLRPQPLVQARQAGLSAEALREVEDEQILSLIRMQEDVGLKVVTDGEARRAFWHYDFMGMLNGFDNEPSQKSKGQPDSFGTGVTPMINGPLSFPADHPMLEHFRFVAEHTSVCPKISIPGPSALHWRQSLKTINYAPYKDNEVFTADIVAAMSQAVRSFYDAGCRYLQLDDIFFAYLSDEEQRAMCRALGWDPDMLVHLYAWMLEECIKDRPDDMIIGMHMCRGNFKSNFVATGGYELAADAIFNKTSVDIYFMEYDTDRAGGLEPLRLLPKGKKRIMAGFITTKTPELESLDQLRSQFEAASEFVDMDQLGIAPQCGFSSSEHGNDITEDDQRQKLELVVRLAEELWSET